VDPQRNVTTTTTDATASPADPLVDPVDPDLSALGTTTPGAPATGRGSDDGGGRAAQIKDAASTAGDEAKHVAATAADQARSVVQEVKDQAGGLVRQTRGELRAQADTRSADAAGAMHTLSDRIRALAEGRPDDAGPLVGYLNEAGGRVAGLASRVDQRGLDGVLTDVSGFARRRPGLFLLAAAGAGFVAGRLVRSGARAANDAGPGAAASSGELAASDPFVAVPPPVDVATPTPVTTGVQVP
jgi:hypothetical protein